MKILNKIILLFLAVYGQDLKIEVLIWAETSNLSCISRNRSKFNKKSNLCQCRYSKGIKGHPKVTIQKNPASVYRLKRRVSKDCKKKCENEKTCEVYAVNIEKQLCHIFTYEDLDQKKIIWEQDNDNMQWVS